MGVNPRSGKRCRKLLCKYVDSGQATSAIEIECKCGHVTRLLL